ERVDLLDGVDLGVELLARGGLYVLLLRARARVDLADAARWRALRGLRRRGLTRRRCTGRRLIELDLPPRCATRRRIRGLCRRRLSPRLLSLCERGRRQQQKRCCHEEPPSSLLHRYPFWRRCASAVGSVQLVLGGTATALDDSGL